MDFPPISAVSFSKLIEFESCKYRTYLSSVVKSPRPEADENSPLERGTRIHEGIESYIRSQANELPKEVKKPKTTEHIDYVKELFTVGEASVEEDWGFDKDWLKTGYYDDNIWLRVKLDAMTMLDEDTAFITDWKTGKSAGKEVRTMQQGQLYCIAAMMRDPKIMTAQPVFAYTDEDKLIKLKPMTRKEMPRYLNRFTSRFDKITSCVDFTPSPNKMNCMWCPFGPNVGTGACAHGIEK